MDLVDVRIRRHAFLRHTWEQRVERHFCPCWNRADVVGLGWAQENGSDSQSSAPKSNILSSGSRTPFGGWDFCRSPRSNHTLMTATICMMQYKMRLAIFCCIGAHSTLQNAYFCLFSPSQSVLGRGANLASRCWHRTRGRFSRK
jgi:hypothetical protein